VPKASNVTNLRGGMNSGRAPSMRGGVKYPLQQHLIAISLMPRILSAVDVNLIYAPAESQMSFTKT